MGKYIYHQSAEEFIPTLKDKSVSLAVLDPPYYKITKEAWDNSWPNALEFENWLTAICASIKPKLKNNGSLLLFGGIGKHKEHPFLNVMMRLENFYHYQDWITWKKRKAYGKEKSYLFIREEIIWFSKHQKNVIFNKPYLDEKRGYNGWNKKYPAKSEYKRVGNVFTDINELMKPKRYTQKPEALMNRLIETHSNEGDLIIDTFCGYGSTGISAVKLGRKFLGCEKIKEDAEKGNERIEILS